MKKNLVRGLGIGLLGSAAAVAIAPMASADVTNQNVTVKVTGDVVAGGTYTIVDAAPIVAGQSVKFYDGTTQIGSTVAETATTTSVSVVWSPVAPGKHTIVAKTFAADGTTVVSTDGTVAVTVLGALAGGSSSGGLLGSLGASLS